jgi:hypothetical protein
MNNNNAVTKDESAQILLFDCPHCKQQVIVRLQDVNCKIFRHGIKKSNYEQINPHATKELCDSLVERDLIYGCGKPFKLTDDLTQVEVCDYI